MSTTITAIGTLGGDPELRFTAGGVPVLTFSIASSKRVKDGDEWKDGPTSWRRVTAWRGLAEGLAEKLTKGTRVIVIGEEQVRQYETENGKGTSVEITAEHVGLYLFPKKAGATSPGSGLDAPYSPERQSGDIWAPEGGHNDEVPF